LNKCLYIEIKNGNLHISHSPDCDDSKYRKISMKDIDKNNIFSIKNEDVKIKIELDCEENNKEYRFFI